MAAPRPKACSKCFRTEDRFKKPFTQNPDAPHIALCPHCRGNCFDCGRPIAKDRTYCADCVDKSRRRAKDEDEGIPRFPDSPTRGVHAGAETESDD